MNRDEQEMALWHEAYMLAMSQDPHPTEASNWADSAVAEFRQRYPVEPSAPPAVWYDDAWRMQIVGCPNQHLLAGRRVCPITKPPEPTQ